MKMKFSFALTAVIFFLSFSAFAGPPTMVDESDTGVAYRWPNGVINVYFDRGDFTESITNAAAIKMVEDAWKKWEEGTLQLTVTTDQIPVIKGSIDFVNKGFEGSVDITGTNYQPYVKFDGNSQYNASHNTVVIFDQTGEIMLDIIAGGDDKMDVDDVSGYLGVTFIDNTDQTTHVIKNGTIVFNGNALTDQVESTIRPSILHELGHLLNLDHSALNDPCLDTVNCADGDTDAVGATFPTMHYSIVSFSASADYATDYGLYHPQYSLHADDIAWAAYLYNHDKDTSLIKTDFCTVTGQLQDVYQRPFQGIQVYAKAVGGTGEDEYSQADAYSTVTGVFYNACAKTKDVSGAYNKREGRFIIPGLRPNVTYNLWYSQLPPWPNAGSVCSSLAECTTEGSLGSGINPYAPPRDIDKGANDVYIMKTTGDSTDFICTKGGEVLTTKTFTMNVDLDSPQYKYYNISGEKFECDPSTPGKKVEEAESGGESHWYSSFDDRFKKGWCSLNPAAGASAVDMMWLLIPALVVVYRRFRG